MPLVVRHVFPVEMKAEVARFIFLIRLAFVDFRVAPSPAVAASDASEYSGGVAMSQGLSESGVVGAGCAIRGDLVEPLPVTSVLACPIGWNAGGHVIVEGGGRVVEARQGSGAKLGWTVQSG